MAGYGITNDNIVENITDGSKVEVLKSADVQAKELQDQILADKNAAEAAGKLLEEVTVTTETKMTDGAEIDWQRNDRARVLIREELVEKQRQTFENDQFETTDLPGNPAR